MVNLMYALNVSKVNNQRKNGYVKDKKRFNALFKLFFY